MPRRPRLVLANVPLHIIQRGNNRHVCFSHDADYLVYLDMLGDCATKADCAIHAYVLMTNHVHLLVSPQDLCGAATLMRSLGQRYVQYFNRRHVRTGTLWEGRFRSCLVDHARYLLVCQRYIELNPVRAGIVAHPLQYRWSSYRANADGDENSLITPHAIYAHLGSDRASCESAYRALFETELPERILSEVRLATNGNFALGPDGFAQEVEWTLGRYAQPQKPGRRTDG